MYMYGDPRICYAQWLILEVIHVCQVLIQNLACMYHNLLITGITLRGENGGCPPALLVPHRNAVWIQTYQGLLRDLRTRSKN